MKLGRYLWLLRLRPAFRFRLWRIWRLQRIRPHRRYCLCLHGRLLGHQRILRRLWVRGWRRMRAFPCRVRFHDGRLRRRLLLLRAQVRGRSVRGLRNRQPLRTLGCLLWSVRTGPCGQGVWPRRLRTLNILWARTWWKHLRVRSFHSHQNHLRHLRRISLVANKTRIAWLFTYT